MTDQDPDIDAARLEEATGGDAEFMRELLELFLGDVQTHVDALAAAVSAGNTADAKQAAHTIKGSSSNVGAARVQKIAFAMERAAIGGDQAELQRKMFELRDAIARLGPAIQAILG